MTDLPIQDAPPQFRCAQCWKYHPADQFIGARGGRVNMCATCRHKYKRWDKKSLEERITARPVRHDGPYTAHVALTLRSQNVKTGPIPVSISEPATCPTSCAFYGAGCYASYGKLGGHWKRTTERGMPWEDFLTAVRRMRPGQLWRHNEAGDLPGAGKTLDTVALAELVSANVGRRGFTFTHKPMTPKAAQAVHRANKRGFTINLSADSIAQADQLYSLGVGPVAVVLPEGTLKRLRTPMGRIVVQCPAQTRGLTCNDCELCSKPQRKAIIGFAAHGQFKALVTDLVRDRRTPAKIASDKSEAVADRVALIADRLSHPLVVRNRIDMLAARIARAKKRCVSCEGPNRGSEYSECYHCWKKRTKRLEKERAHAHQIHRSECKSGGRKAQGSEADPNPRRDGLGVGIVE